MSIKQMQSFLVLSINLITLSEIKRLWLIVPLDPELVKIDRPAFLCLAPHFYSPVVARY
jgi:hypothetical protein